MPPERENQTNKKAVTYFLPRLLIFGVAIFIFYNYSEYFLPQNIREDRFSFIAELHTFLQVTFIFSIFYSVYIYFELTRFIKKSLTKYRNCALVLLVISIVVAIASLLTSLTV